MKLTIDRARFSESLKWVGKAIARNPTAPVMSGVVIEAAGDTVTLFGSNYDVSHRITVPAEVSAEGKLLIPGPLASDLVAALRGTTVDVIAEGSGLLLRAGRSNYRLPSMPLHDYPTAQTFPPTVGTVATEDLALLVRNVKLVIDPRHSVQGLQGVRFEAHGGELRTVGTDRFVVSTATTVWDYDTEFDCTAPVAQVEAALSGMNGPVEVGIDESTLGFKDANHEVTIRVLAAEFGNWRVALRAADDFTVEVDTAELADAIKRASLAIPTPKSPVWITVTADAFEIRTDAGESSDGVELVEAVATGEITTGVAPSYLADCLATITTDQVQLGFVNNRRHPIVVTPLNDDSLMHVVMPRLPNV